MDISMHTAVEREKRKKDRKYKYISFDIDGTLIVRKFTDLVWEEGVPKIYAKEKNISFENAKKYVLEEYRKVTPERIEWYDIKYWFSLFKLRTDWHTLLKDYEKEIKLYPEVLEVLDELSKKYILIIISNASREFISVTLKNIAHYFVHIFSATSDFKEVKKTPHVYLKICNILNIQPFELLHVGDNLEFDYKVPSQIGIRAFYLDREKETKEDFAIHSLKELPEKINY